VLRSQQHNQRQRHRKQSCRAAGWAWSGFWCLRGLVRQPCVTLACAAMWACHDLDCCSGAMCWA
jgi:hypothetical protein